MWMPDSLSFFDHGTFPRRGSCHWVAFGAAILVALLAILPAWSQQAVPHGIGRTPTDEQIRAWDISIAPDGKGLPPGEGNAIEGKSVYDVRCAECHGDKAQGAEQAALVGGRDSLNTPKPLKTVASFWPYATTLWDYTNRAMPYDTPRVLTHDQVYAVVAYILYLDGIIGENDVMNAETLPQVKMPNRDGFVPDPRPDTRNAAK